MQQPRVGLPESANPGLSDSIPSGLQDGYGYRFGEQAISIPLKTSKNPVLECKWFMERHFDSFATKRRSRRTAELQSKMNWPEKSAKRCG
jgi:hypothetical protein